MSFTGFNADYYKFGGTETIDIIKTKQTTQEYTGFLSGNVVKYIFRAGKKPGNTRLSDYQKAKFYIDKLIENEE